MAALTLRLLDDKHQRLRALAQSRHTTINRLMIVATTLMLAEFDAETRFKLRSTRGAGREQEELALLGRVAAERPEATW